MTRPKITPAQMAELYKKIRAISENREARKKYAQRTNNPNRLYRKAGNKKAEK